MFQLLEHQEFLLGKSSEGNNINVIYRDFAKVLDSIDDGVLILLHKIKNLEIKGKLGIWLHSFLSGRRQAVVVKGTKSSSAAVRNHCDLPQG